MLRVILRLRAVELATCLLSFSYVMVLLLPMADEAPADARGPMIALLAITSACAVVMPSCLIFMLMDKLREWIDREEPDPSRSCVNCRRRVKVEFCSRPGDVHPVTGLEGSTRLIHCERARSASGWCGPSGRQWAAVPARPAPPPPPPPPRFPSGPIRLERTYITKP